MPWCEDCAKYYTPNSVEEDGTCPSCGETLQLPEGAESEAAGDDESTPWHFKLMVVVLVVYLTWRFVQLLT